jgi:Lrp/AsnC family transcriptional regulator, leucine-responsive regulatory protein
MKDIRNRAIELLKVGYCTPGIAGLARKLKEPSTTVYYNVKQMEKEKAIIGYKAVFDYKKIDEGFCNFVLLNLASDEYGNPEMIGRDLLSFPQIESIDIITGGWEMLIKVRTKDIDEYYQFVKNVLSKKGITKTTSLSSLKQLKTEFIELQSD